MKIYRDDSTSPKLARVNWYMVLSISVNGGSLFDCNIYDPACVLFRWDALSFTGLQEGICVEDPSRVKL